MKGRQIKRSINRRQGVIYRGKGEEYKGEEVKG